MLQPEILNFYAQILDYWSFPDENILIFALRGLVYEFVALESQCRDYETLF